MSTNKDNTKDGRPGYIVAWCAVVLGVSMSVAANALHVVTVVGPTMGGATVPQVVSAAFWPIALVIMVEVIARVRWPDSTAFALLRWGGAGVVALVAAIVSYRHMHGLLIHWREDAITALLGPVGVDGLVTVGAVALMAISHQPTPKKTKTTKAPAPKAAAPVPEADKPSPRPEPVPTTARPEPTPPVTRPEPDAPKPSRPAAVDLSGLGLPPSVTDRIGNYLNMIAATGATPTAGAIAEAGRIPRGLANQVLARIGTA